MSIWGMGVMVGPILGPTLGGYLTYDFNWRYVFFVNLPFGIIAVLGLLFLMPKVKPRGGGLFDWTGFAALSIGLAGLQIALDRGEELDWLSSPTIIACLVVAGIGFYLFMVQMFLGRNPFISRAIFNDRNFVASLITMFSVGMVLLASSALLAPFLENLGNYPVASAGLVMAPRGIGTMLAMMIAGRLVAKTDPRLLMLFGYILLGIAIYMQEGWMPSEPESYMILTIVIQGTGLGFVFVPLQVVAFNTMSPEMRTQGTSLLSLVRNVGSAIGISLTSALLVRQGQYEHAVLSQYVTPFSRPLQTGGIVGKMLDPTTAAGASMLNTIINTQSQIIAYVDDYKFLLLTTLPAMACLLLMSRPANAKPAAAPHAAMD